MLGFTPIAQREGGWAIVDLVGKHGFVHTFPMPSWAKAALDRWAADGIDQGPVLRGGNNAGRIGPGPLGAQSIFETVAAYGRLGGVGKTTPHNLRRTFAKLAH